MEKTAAAAAFREIQHEKALFIAAFGQKGLVIFMTVQKRLDRVYQTAPEIPFDDTSRFVFMSDCHRGDGSWADNFARNQNLCYAALRHYYIKGFTYFELGDGDELWENKCLCDIVTMHSDIFSLMARFYREGRLYMLYGNHDMAKKSKSIYKSYAVVEDEFEQTKKALFPDIAIHESLKLRHRRTGREILLTHGHQADFLNYRLWRLARFLVRYLWRPLELSGINDPTDPGKNYHKKSRVHQCLSDWSAQNQCMLIAGHTHKPALPPPGESLYFNDGSCVHPRCITAVELENGMAALVKWAHFTKMDGTLYVDREILAGPYEIEAYF